MSKKSKKEKKLRKLMRRAYNKQEFRNILCSNCSVCDDYSPGPEWCYILYKDDPEQFLRQCYTKLIKLGSWSTGDLHGENKTLEGHLFRSLFCKSNICAKAWSEGESPDSCPLIDDCLNQFHAQISSAGIGFVPNETIRPKAGKRKVQEQRGNKRVKRKKEKYICQPYPTFFTNGRAEWEKEIKFLLEDNGNTEEDGDTTNEPDHYTAGA